MKSYCCPICGEKQKVKLAIQSKALLPCHRCGKPQLTNVEKDVVTVKVYVTAEEEQKSQSSA